jgi:hypothetical protein
MPPRPDGCAGTCGYARRSPAAPAGRGWSSTGRRGTCSRRSWTTARAARWPRRPAIRGTEGDKTAKARRVGELLAQRAAQAGIEAVVFDRGGYRYHGRVAALADGAREGGLQL